MNKLIWNEEKLIQLDSEFLKQVLKNMEDDNVSIVYFGITGKGIRPNYQITYGNGNSIAFAGIDHKRFSRANTFDKTKISRPFTYKSIHTLSVYKQNDNSSFFPEEVQDNKKYYEGSTKKIKVNIYERNHEARRKCIKHYGINCCICGFNFEKKYGEIGNSFIHVHHLKLLSKIGEEYELDPIQDLRPVCPNCHAMLHKRKSPYSIEELKQIISTNSKRAK